MEAVSRWLCSFKADNVRVTPHTRTVKCGNNVLLCSIDLPNSTSMFTNYHENKITVLYRNRNAEAIDCCFDIKKVNSRKLDVYCYARRTGKATVRLDLGKWYQFKGPTYYYQDLDNIDILPSIPKYLRDVEVCCQKNSLDDQHAHEEGTVYYGITSFLKFNAVDRFQNIIHQLEDERYDVEIRYSEYNVSQNVEWEMREGRVSAIFLPDIIGEKHMVVQLVNRGLNQAPLCTCQLPVKVFYPPCSPSLTLKVLDNNDLEQFTTAGEEFAFEVKLLDIFENPVLENSNEKYEIIVQAPVPKRVMKQHQKEQVNTRKINSPKSFAVALGFKIAGRRNVNMKMKCGSKSSFKDIYVQVLSSVPHHLNDVRFTTNGAVEESFVPDPTVMYRNQWSILEGRLVDCYDNVVELSDNYTISLQLTDKGKETEVESKDLEIINKTFRVRMQINQAGKHNLVMTLTNLNLPDKIIRLKDTQVQVKDAPLYLAGSQLHYPNTCVAGNEIQVEVLPLDVFGRPLPSHSTANFDLAGNILDSRMKPSCNKETDCKSTKKRPVKKAFSKSVITGHTKEQVSIKKITKPERLSFAVTIRFTIAGIRKARLVINSGSMSSSKDISVKVCPSAPHYLHNIRFTTSGAIDESFSAVPTVIYTNQWSLLEATIFDSYDNVVHQLSANVSINLQLCNHKGEEMEMECKNAEIRNEQFRVQVRTNLAGEHNLLITLTSGNSPDQVYRLEATKIQVNEAPLYLLGSEFHCPEECVAGKEIQFEIFLVDVFGFLIPADSSASRITLTGNILNSPLEQSENKETIDLTIVKDESSIVICATVVLTKAGEREVFICDKDNKQKELRIHVNSDVNDVHWEFTAPKETAYRREKLIITARLLDRFSNDVRADTLKSTPDLRKKEGFDGLHYVGKSIENNKVVIRWYFKQIGKYDLCLVNSNGNSIEDSSFSVSVQDAPLDYNRSTIEWIPQYDDIPDQPVFPDDEIFKCCLSLTDVVGYDYDGEIEMDCIKVRYGNTEVKNIEVSSCANDIGSYNIVIPLKNLVKDDPSPQFWCFVNGMKIENPLTLPTFETFDKYDDDWNCVVNHKRYEFVKIVCRDVRKNDIIGSDYCNLNNVKRVCNLCDDPKVRTFQIESIDDDPMEYINDESVREEDQDSDYDDSDYHGYHEHYDHDSDDDDDNDLTCTVITLPFEEIIICHPEEIKTKIQKFRDILLHLLRAIYYREQAFELDKDRETWKERASDNYRRIQEGESTDKTRPRVCSQIKEKYAILMRRYHDAACEEFFQFFNAERGQSEIDLHGLLVVDEKKLRDYERQLCFRGRMSLHEVDQKIKKERENGNEAIRKLRERLKNYDKAKARKEGEPWLEIIVGSGHHSKERQKIRPKVEEYLKERKLSFSPVNKGALVVTFEKYAGPEPCFGEYYCNKCDNRWRNGHSWVDKWQACYVCWKDEEMEELFEKCYPLKQRENKKQQRHNPKFVSRQPRYVPNHVQKLCQKCIELGKECQRAW